MVMEKKFVRFDIAQVHAPNATVWIPSITLLLGEDSMWTALLEAAFEAKCLISNRAIIKRDYMGSYFEGYNTLGALPNAEIIDKIKSPISWN